MRQPDTNMASVGGHIGFHGWTGATPRARELMAMTSHEGWLTQGITLWFGYFLLIGGIAAMVMGNWALAIGLLAGSVALMALGVKGIPGCMTEGTEEEPVRNPAEGLHL